MSRKTYSLSAAVVVAISGLSFSSADGAEALAQETSQIERDEAMSLSADEESAQVLSKEPVELVPEPIEFVSEPVIQALPEIGSVAGLENQGIAVKPATLRELVAQTELTAPLSEQMRCLAGAVYFESRGEPLAGQLAVANVVINRADDRRFPASYCGVVYQRAQFSFVKRGRMPRIRTQSAAWRRAKAIAHIAHDGLWESEAADAVYFHATYVRPKWSRRKTRLTEIDTHIFYR